MDEVEADPSPKFPRAAKAWSVPSGGTHPRNLPSMASMDGISYKSQDTTTSSIGREIDPDQSIDLINLNESNGEQEVKKSLFARLQARGKVAPAGHGKGTLATMDVSTDDEKSQRVGTGAKETSISGEVQTAMELEEEAELSGQVKQYVPYSLAQEWIAKMGSKMQAMKSKHNLIAVEMDGAYRRIEADTEVYFEAFVGRLREQQHQKVTRFRDVLKLTKDEQRTKEREWRRTVEDLVSRNKALAENKQTLLSQIKKLFGQLQSEKEALQQQMTDQLNVERQARAADIESLRTQHNKEVTASAVLLQSSIEEKRQEWEAQLEESKEDWQKNSEGHCTELATHATDLMTTVQDAVNGRLEEMKKRLLNIEGSIGNLGTPSKQGPSPLVALHVQSASPLHTTAAMADYQNQLRVAQAKLATISAVIPSLSEEQQEGLRKDLQSKEDELSKASPESPDASRRLLEMEAIRLLLSEEPPTSLPLMLSVPQPAAVIVDRSYQQENCIAVRCLFEMLQVMSARLPPASDLSDQQADCASELASLQKDTEVVNAGDSGVQTQTPTHETRKLHLKARSAALEILQTVDQIGSVDELAEQLGLVMPAESGFARAGRGPAADSSSEENSDDDDEDYQEEDSKENDHDAGSDPQEARPSTGDTFRGKSLRKQASKADRLMELAAAGTEEIEKLEKEIEEKEKQLHDLKLEFSNVQVELVDLRSENGSLKSESQRNEVLLRAEYEEKLKSKESTLNDCQVQLKQLEEERLQGLPVDTAEEVMRYRDKLAIMEQDIDDQRKAVSKEQMKNLKDSSRVTELEARVTQAEKTADEFRVLHVSVSAEKDKELIGLKEQLRIAKESQSAAASRTVKALESKVKELEKRAQTSGGKASMTVAAGKPGTKESGNVADLKKQLKTANGKVQELTVKVKQLGKEMATAGRGGGAGSQSGAGSVEDKRELKKREKELKELSKQLEQVKQRLEAKTSAHKASDEELKRTGKELQQASGEIARLNSEIQRLGSEAKVAVENAEKARVLQEKVKNLNEELATSAENYNNERVLRKKYYNIIEDMKGKIRVYCRARPLSKSEKERGNFSVIGSPDEYTITIQGQRGVKEFSFDQVFTPEHSQEKVFEDTNNLIQSAMDGYNVCIFAYGQTGSGKTYGRYTMIGADTSLDSPMRGIAPRAFMSIFGLIEANKKKFSCELSVYMLELYNERLLDLLAIGKDPSKLDIKKNKKGMVIVTGSTTKTASSAEQLLDIFQQGSQNRHVACTKMNAESSRSHLVLGIVITSTNLATGTVVAGKLSIVDLAGSERASKTGATPEQLKEAQSINKSLSALGDVISALSTGQSHIPYRNNKLTMLMQDSLGGNAKTLMFVNISPADYNCDESIVSLTYASRVKLITNDASKNADNKEITRLKGVISKLKKGEQVDEEDA